MDWNKTFEVKKMGKIIETLNEAQKNMLYYTIGKILEDGKNCLEPRLFASSYDNRIRTIYNTLDETQKKCVEYFINKATSESEGKTTRTYRRK